MLRVTLASLYPHLRLQLLFSIEASKQKHDPETTFLTLRSASGTEIHLTKYSPKNVFILVKVISEQIWL